MHITINPTYKNNRYLSTFLYNIPKLFAEGGDLLWDGRNKIKLFKDNNISFVVKHFKLPNIIQQIGYLFLKYKAQKAYDNGIELCRRGIDTPEPIACVELSKGPFVSDSYYICKELTPATEIKDAFDDPSWDKDVALAFAQFFAEMHSKGILHHDMNNTNVLVSKTDRGIHFQLIDINRVSFFNNIADIPMKDRIENMTRFSSNYGLMEHIFREYAKACGMVNIDNFVYVAMKQKRHHDMTYHRRKAILHPLRKR